jgi:UMF1 family MFS transporter
MHPDEHEHDVVPAYEGEDTRLTSQKEKWGWYCYGWAAEVFAICGLGEHYGLSSWRNSIV